MAGHGSQIFSGGNSGGETPGPIPNPEAKPTSADGTALERVWESRTPPLSHLSGGGVRTTRFTHPLHSFHTPQKTTPLTSHHASLHWRSLLLDSADGMLRSASVQSRGHLLVQEYWRHPQLSELIYLRREVVVWSKSKLRTVSRRFLTVLAATI